MASVGVLRQANQPEVPTTTACCAAQLRELAQEVEGAPEEVGASGAAAGMDSAVGRRQLRQLETRAAAEEDLMMRVPLSKVCRTSTKAVHVHIAHRHSVAQTEKCGPFQT